MADICGDAGIRHVCFQRDVRQWNATKKSQCSALRFQIRTRDRTDAQAIDDVSSSVLSVCNIPAPRTGLEGKFSLRATTAMALLGHDTSSLDAFTDAKVNDPRLVAVRDHVRVVPIEKLAPTRATVIVKSGGRRFQAEADSGEPSASLAAQRESLTRKFMALSSPILGRAGADALAQAALRADTVSPAAELMRLSRGA